MDESFQEEGPFLCCKEINLATLDRGLFHARAARCNVSLVKTGLQREKVATCRPCLCPCLACSGPEEVLESSLNSVRLYIQRMELRDPVPAV